MSSTSRFKLTCPNCGRIGSTSQQLRAGSKVKCPNCQEVNYIGEDGTLSETPSRTVAEPAPVAVPVAKETRHVSSSSLETPAFPPPPPAQNFVHRESIQAAPSVAPIHQYVEVNVPEPQKGNAIAIASLVLGILAALACWIPFIGLVAIPLGLLGLLLGTIGLTLVVVVKRRGLAAALVGTVLSLAAMVLSFAITGITSKRLSEAIEKAAAKDVSIAKAVAAAPANAVVSAPKDAHTAPAPKPDPEAVSYPESARLGEVEVRVTRVLRGEISLRNLIDSDRHERSQDPFLSIYLEVKNVGDGRKLDYRTFEGTGFRLDHATLGDDLGNRYRSANFGFTTKPEGQADAKSLYPGEVVTDQLVFEIPVAKASSLTLELPAEVAGLGEGVFRFKIPASAIETLKSD